MTVLSYRVDHAPSTNSGSVVCSPWLGTAVLFTGMLLAPCPSENAEAQRHDSYIVPMNGTYSSLQNAFSGEYAKLRDLDFEGSVAVFYAELLGQQEPLGTDFQKILYENLWELYDD